MPRAFLVKKPCVSTCKRNWSELPDEERGEIYVPGESPARGPQAPRCSRAWVPVEAADLRAQWCEPGGLRSCGTGFNV